MADLSYWGDFQPGQVRALAPEDNPPISTLVQAFQGQELNAATDAIVLRGYLGRSNIIQRVLDYLERAKGSSKRIDNVLQAGTVVAVGVEPPAPATGATAPPATGASPTEKGLKDLETSLRGPIATKAVLDETIKTVKDLAERAQEHIPWRIYLTPRLDTYVDFHRSSLLAFRRDARTERQDACTVWLRVFDAQTTLPIPYRVVQETMLGPSFAQWLDGAVVDDYVEQSGLGSSAWGNQSAFGRKPGSGTGCAMFGRKAGSGTGCAE